MSTILTAALETALNRYLALDPEARARLTPLAGRVIALELRGLGLRLFFLPGEHDIQILQQCEDAADATIAGTPLALARLALAERPGEGLFSDAVELRGDTGLAQRFQALLQSVQVDWEEQLARLVGDQLAHQTGRAVRHGRDYASRTSRTLRADLSEYLTEEARLLPSRPELELFHADVDVLRDDVERLEARLQRLERRLSESE
ncbi:hypothetical protein TspCOW1_24450 [Thiohalobacter sp. COW1]|uniref:Ubiquinone biosynthesis accessory factor UbiJ n=1 Tax=Thiohalobacter thiocyanaticus TaxID=585455 RepID=A0A1Z4VM62_9GAMM|nr:MULTISPECIES: SCP2 sterol-binding domain-containing protein [Thiohalobacter]BAZ92699.1 sterol-binding domain protein [Thiohalobacter thiocyanaticus]BCO32342.1 hypothetical protein TspCOW1_24450 [Thiohalobacter sp. COW1]